MPRSPEFSAQMTLRGCCLRGAYDLGLTVQTEVPHARMGLGLEGGGAGHGLAVSTSGTEL